MRIITRRTLGEFWTGASKYADARAPLEAWYDEVRRATWRSPADIKSRHRNASVLKHGRVMFNIGGNKYRLVVHINYAVGVVFVRFVATHAQYDAIDAETI